MYIILEYYLMENFIINFIILYITKHITKTNVNIKRILFGGLLSALYSLIFFFPPLIFLSKFYMKVIISIIIVKISFKTKKNKLLMQQILGFYIVSFVFAGLISSLSWNSNNVFFLLLNKVKLRHIFKSKYVITGVVLGTIITYKSFNYSFKINIQDNFIVDVEIFLRGRSVRLKALIDTGNSLIEPVSKKSVFVVEFQDLKELLPLSVKKIYEYDLLRDSDLLEILWEELNKEIILTIIPFKSLGSNDGIILGFTPDYIKIKTGEGEIIREDILIGIYQDVLSSGMEYSGLLTYEIAIGGDYGEKFKV